MSIGGVNEDSIRIYTGVLKNHSLSANKLKEEKKKNNNDKKKEIFQTIWRRKNIHFKDKKFNGIAVFSLSIIPLKQKLLTLHNIL